MSDKFDIAFERVIGHEGGFQADPRDRGNWTSGVPGKGELKGTKFGVSAMSYPTLDIEHLTVDHAKQIYMADYWLKTGCNELEFAAAFQVFDAAVNHGTSAAVRMIQCAIGVPEDGLLGPVTREAMRRAAVIKFVMRFLAERIEYFTHANGFAQYGKGWMRRMADNLRYGAVDLE